MHQTDSLNASFIYYVASVIPNNIDQQEVTSSLSLLSAVQTRLLPTNFRCASFSRSYFHFVSQCTAQLGAFCLLSWIPCIKCMGCPRFRATHLAPCWSRHTFAPRSCGASDIFKCPETGETTKSLEYERHSSTTGLAKRSFLRTVFEYRESSTPRSLILCCCVFLWKYFSRESSCT